MYKKIYIFPNLPDEQTVAFTLHIQAEEQLILDDFELHLEGHIPASDSVKELRERALARAKAILKELCAE